MKYYVGPPCDEVDYLVIGSGFGGSVAAATLAENVGETHTVCLLERGKAYPPGSFPRSWDGLQANFWMPHRGRHGMFQRWNFTGIEAITASGLGGGSLIYANVMLQKPADWFTQPVPCGDGKTETWSFRHADLLCHYEAVSDFLRVGPMPEQFADKESPKTRRFLDELPGTELAPLAVRFRASETSAPEVGKPLLDEPYPNIHGEVERTTCKMVGECDVGCNAGAKSSMDHTYLSMAAHHFAKICIRTEVREIALCTDDPHFLFKVGYVVHPEGNPGRPPSEVPKLRWIKAKRVVLAAGTLNSTQLMLRNAKNLGIAKTNLIGSRFCGNGDLLGFALPQPHGPGLIPSGGPVITTYSRFDDAQGRMLLQDGGVPDLRSWKNLSLTEAFRVGRNLLREWRDTMTPPRGLVPTARERFRFFRVHWPLPLLAMGTDTPDGCLTWNETTETLECDWTIDTSQPHFDEARRKMASLSAQLGSYPLPDPQWNVNSIITVHPLGGCPADTSAVEGVVDGYGRVRGVPGMWITDGSVMPGPVGANPSLTIAAFARRAALKLREEGLGKPSTPIPFRPHQ